MILFCRVALLASTRGGDLFSKSHEIPSLSVYRITR